MFAEMVPLLPTQPLSLVAGLLFGPVKGAGFILLGCTLAAFNAFSIARGVGRPLAEKVIKQEMGDGHGNSVAASLASVTSAIESGGFWKQYVAVTLLRLTPVVPFSASNYLLGMTPLQLPPFLAATVTGMSVWSLAFASFGGAGRSLLRNGADLGTVLTDMSEKAGAVSGKVAAAGVAIAVTSFVVSRLVSSSGRNASATQQPETVHSDNNNTSSLLATTKTSSSASAPNGNPTAESVPENASTPVAESTAVKSHSSL